MNTISTTTELRNLLTEDYKGLRDLYEKIALAMGLEVTEDLYYVPENLAISEDLAIILFKEAILLEAQDAGIVGAMARLEHRLKENPEDKLAEKVYKIAYDKLAKATIATLDNYGPTVDETLPKGTITINNGFFVDKNKNPVLPLEVSAIVKGLN